MARIFKARVEKHEAHAGTYLAGRGVGMSVSPCEAFRIAHRLADQDLSRQNEMGGVPILEIRWLNGVEVGAD